MKKVKVKIKQCLKNLILQQSNNMLTNLLLYTYPIIWYRCRLAWSSRTGLQGAGSDTVAPQTNTFTYEEFSEQETCRSTFRTHPPRSIVCNKEMWT